MAQLMLFETDSETRTDGSLVVRPKKLVTGQEIGVSKAAGMLGFRDKKAVFRLIEMGELRAWKPDTLRGNGKWRIDLQGVLEYKERRMRLCGSC